MPDSENQSAAQQIKGAPALPGEACATAPNEKWSETEKWVWEQVSKGEIANFNDRYGHLDPASYPLWTENRKISSAFLETILLHEPYRSVLPRQGVRIKGAWLRQTLDLKYAVLDHVWWLDESRVEAAVKLGSLKSSCNISFEDSVFTGTVDLTLSQIGGQLNMNGVKCAGNLCMNQIEVHGNLFMRESEFKSGIDLRAAKVKGGLEMDGATLAGELNMDSLKIDGNLWIREGAELSSVSIKSVQVGGQLDLSNAKIEQLDLFSLDVNGRLQMDNAKFSKFQLKGVTVRHLYMSGAECEGELKLDSLAIRGSLRMKKARFSKFELKSATIGGVFDMSGAMCNGAGGTVYMYGLDLTGDMLMTDAQFSHVDLRYAKIGGRVDIAGGRFASMDLTGSSIRTVLQMGSNDASKVTWLSGECSRLLLRNTVVDAVQAPQLDAFPAVLDLNGFKYAHLGEWRGEERKKLTEEYSDMSSRESKWFIGWLERNRSYSPQPYLQLAEVLRNMGHPVKANDVLFAGKKSERKEIWNRIKVGKYGVKLKEAFKWAWLFLLQITIGYGYRYLYALGWVAVFTIIGAIFFALACHGSPIDCEGMPIKPWRLESLAFSFDLLLPIVKLNECHYKIFSKLGNWRYYFYFHELLGYSLGSFVVAGLSGITKK